MKCLGLFCIHLNNIRGETLKSLALLWYKIHVVYMDCTYQTTSHRKKCCEVFGPEGVVCKIVAVLAFAHPSIYHCYYFNFMYNNSSVYY